MNPRPPLMDMANMRENGVTHVLLTCLACNHQGKADASRFPDDLPVIHAARRFRCSVCGSKRIECRPAWPDLRKRG